MGGEGLKGEMAGERLKSPKKGEDQG